MTKAFRRMAEKRNKMVRQPLPSTEKSAKLSSFRLIVPLDEKRTTYLAKKSQTPPDLVVNSQRIDIAEVLL